MPVKERFRLRAAWCLLTVTVIAVLAGCEDTPDERRAKIYERARQGDASDIAWIREQLLDPRADVRATALFQLVASEAADAEALATSAAADEDSLVRKIAAKCLGDLGRSSSVPTLADLVLEDSDPRVRRAAAEALLEIGGPGAIAPLLQALEDPIKEVRLAAIRGVVRRAPDQAVESLASALLDDPEWEVRVQAAAGLGRSGRADMVAILNQAANDPNEFVRASVRKALQELEGATPPDG